MHTHAYTCMHMQAIIENLLETQVPLTYLLYLLTYLLAYLLTYLLETQFPTRGEREEDDKDAAAAGASCK